MYRVVMLFFCFLKNQNDARLRHRLGLGYGAGYPSSVSVRHGWLTKETIIGFEFHKLAPMRVRRLHRVRHQGWKIGLHYLASILCGVVLSLALLVTSSSIRRLLSAQLDAETIVTPRAAEFAEQLRNLRNLPAATAFTDVV